MEIWFSDDAFEDLDVIEIFLLYRWNDKVLEDFNKKLRACLNTIMEGNVVFQKYEDTDYHKFLITKHNTLIYKIEDNILKIYRIINNFQNPEDHYESITQKS